MAKIPHSPQNNPHPLLDAGFFENKTTSETELRQVFAAQFSIFMSNTISNFTPAQYVTGKVNYVVYYVNDPITNQRTRKRHRLDHIKDARERARFAKQLVHSINLKLYAGWNPLTENAASREYALMCQVLDSYEKSKKRDLRKHSSRSYKSLVERFRQRMTVIEKINQPIGCFTEMDAVRMMEFVSELNINNRTYNNHLRLYKTMFNWMIEHRYIGKNHFDKIKMKPVAEKNRKIIPEDVRSILVQHQKKSDPRFLMIQKLIYYTFIRPTEILGLKFENIDLANHVITIPAHLSKNKKTQSVTIPWAIHTDLVAICDGQILSNYIFSDGRTLEPGITKLDSRTLTKRWSRLRSALKLPKYYQLYSLKDTGMSEMLSESDSKTVMHQARHADLTTTTKYLAQTPKSIMSVLETSIRF